MAKFTVTRNDDTIKEIDADEMDYLTGSGYTVLRKEGTTVAMFEPGTFRTIIRDE